MKKSELRRLLAMLAAPDTDPATFNFVLERIMGAIYGAESDISPRKSRDSKAVQ